MVLTGVFLVGTIRLRLGLELAHGKICDTVVPGLCLWLSMVSPYVSSLGGGGMA